MAQKSIVIISSKTSDYESMFLAEDFVGYITLEDVSESVKPGVIYELINTGNGFVFIDKHNRQEIKLSYSQAEVLRVLLKLEDRKNDIKFSQYKRVK